MKTKAATTTATSTAAPHRIIRVSMRHHRRLECVSSARSHVRSNLLWRLSARSLYSHSTSEVDRAAMGMPAEGANAGLSVAARAAGAAGAAGATGGNQSSMMFSFHEGLARLPSCL